VVEQIVTRRDLAKHLANGLRRCLRIRGLLRPSHPGTFFRGLLWRSHRHRYCLAEIAARVPRLPSGPNCRNLSMKDLAPKLCPTAATCIAEVSLVDKAAQAHLPTDALGIRGGERALEAVEHVRRISARQ